MMARAGSTNTSDSWLIREPEAAYRKKAETRLTSHALADFRKCPELYRKKAQGLIPDEDRPAYLVGRAAHALILEGMERFEADYAVGGPVNPNTGRPCGSQTKAWAEWAVAVGKAVLTDHQYDLILNMAAGVGTHPVAAQLLAEGIAEGVVRAEYCGLPCQSRLDFFNAERGITDLKSCDDLTWFEADARRYGYLHQVAFYQAVVECASSTRFPVHIIAVEKKEPHRCGIWRVGDDVLGQARKENEAAIERLKRCREADVWPTGYEDVRVFDYL